MQLCLTLSRPEEPDGHGCDDPAWRARRLCCGRTLDRDCVRHVRRDARAAGAGDDGCAHPAHPGRDRAVAACHVALARPPAFLMRRSQRSMHRALWPVLALAIGIGVTLALVWRPPPPSAPQSDVVR